MGVRRTKKRISLKTETEFGNSERTRIVYYTSGICHVTLINKNQVICHERGKKEEIETTTNRNIRDHL